MHTACTYSRFSLARDRSWLPQLVSCYQEVFSTEPWNEWLRCSECGQRWGISQKEQVEALGYKHCGRDLTPFWPTAQVVADLERELSLPGVSCWVAHQDYYVIGFCHGYPLDIGALDAELGLSGTTVAVQEQFPGLQQVAYQDEIGVRPAFRGRHIASNLFQLRHSDFRAEGLRVGVVRTMTNPPTVTYQWYTATGYKVVGQYGDDLQRVILARSLSK